MINVHIRNKFVDYKFNLWQKYNLLTGDSGEGKTTLYKMISSYDENKQNIQCLGYKKLGTDLTLLRTLADIAMEDDDKVKEDLIHRLDGFLIVLDENSSLLKRRSAPSLLERFNCYFLVICRKVALGLSQFQQTVYLNYHPLENFILLNHIINFHWTSSYVRMLFVKIQKVVCSLCKVFLIDYKYLTLKVQIMIGRVVKPNSYHF